MLFHPTLQGGAGDELRGRFHQRHAIHTGGVMNTPQCHFAHAAPRHVDDTLERRVVCWLYCQAHIGDRVADLLTLVEPQPADHVIWDAEGD
jgi:hypothetical protein